MIGDALRAFRAAPGVTFFILFILTLTISAATTTFSVVDAVVLRPLPFEKPDDLVAISHHRGDRVMSQARSLSALQFLALRDRTEAFSALAAVARGSQTLRTDNQPERLWSARVTSSLFDVLGVRPLVGQPFTSAHEVAGNDRVAVIGYSLWHRRFGGDPGILGRTMQVADGPLLIVGVMPKGFSYPIVDDRVSEIWTPYVIPENERLGTQQSSYLHLVGRVRAGTSIARAQLQIDAVRKTLAAAQPDIYSPAGRFIVTTLAEAVTGPVRGWLLLVLIAVSLLLVITCANVANLLLTRAIARSRELAIRAALGATRARLVKSLLVESLVLSLCAVVLSLLIASWGVGATKASLPAGIARADSIGLDFRVFAAAVAAAVLTGLLFGVLPALQASRDDLVTALRQGATTVTLAPTRWRFSVLVAQIAFASVLLIATTLFVSSFIRLTRADLGFDRSDLLLANDLTGIEGTMAEVVGRLESVPGVTAVGGAAAGSPPLVAAGFEGGSSATRLQLPDMPADAFVSVEFNRVSARYFSAAGIPVLRGRVFTDGDLPTSNIVVLDELAARQLFGDRDPVGRDVQRGDRKLATVIGIVANVRMRGPEADSSPQAYFPGPGNASSYAILIRTSRSAANVIPALHGAIAGLRPEGSRPAQIRRIEDAFRNITARRRFSAGTMAIFGVLALLIGAAGVYGVMSSVVAQRTREIGVRVALGATGAQILGAVLSEVGRYLALGLILGLPMAWLVSRTFSALFFQVRATDLWVYALVAAVLALVGLLAAFIPARRASLIDPLVALRSE